MSEQRWFGCPGCGRCAPTSRDLTALGCEGKHEELMPVSEAQKAEAQAVERFKERLVGDAACMAGARSMRGEATEEELRADAQEVRIEIEAAISSASEEKGS